MMSEMSVFIGDPGVNSRLMPEFPATPNEEATFTCGTVSSVAKDWIFLGVSQETEICRAQRSTSCLIQPQRGDTVLLCQRGGFGRMRKMYVIAVLERASASAANVVFPGGVSLQVAEGQIEVKATRIQLSATANVAIKAPEVEVEGVRGMLRFYRLDALIDQANGRFGTMVAVAKDVSTRVGRLVQKVRYSYRWTEHLDETRAGRMRIKVEERMHVTARHASVLADEHVRIDAKKIDLG